MVWTFIYHGKLANQIARLAANVALKKCNFEIVAPISKHVKFDFMLRMDKKTKALKKGEESLIDTSNCFEFYLCSEGALRSRSHRPDKSLMLIQLS